MRKKKMFRLLIVVVLFMFLFGCENLNQGSGNGKEVPVYQGMEVTGTLENQKACNTPLLFSSGGDDEGDGINQQNPFSKNTGEMIEDELKKKLGTGTSESAEYYTSKNQDFYITIKLSNPDDFVILSFNLNGVRYASYQFHDNSDLENIILKVNSGDVSGIKEYTIDEIKYVDGTEIKDVIFAGNRTVKVGVTYDALPDATISNLKIESTSISLNAQVTDLENLMELYDSPLKIYLYDGNNLIREKELVVGANEVLFDKLLQNTLYQYAIVTRYDSLDGNGSQMVILEKLAFYTNRIIKLTNVAATQESVSFDVVIDDKAEVGSLTAIELYKGNELVKSIEDLTLREFSGLLSNNEYEIRVIYTYNLDDGVDRAVTFTQAVTTKSKTLPRYTSNLERGASSVVLDLTVEDPDSIGKLVSIELYKDNELVECLEDFTEIKFTGLLSNNEYKIVVNFTYDLNEGEGEQPGAMLISFRTKFKNSPYIEIKNVVETKTSIGFELDIIDQDQVGSLTAIELYKDNELVKSLTDLTLREFSGLLSNNEYEIKAIYTYDMNDGFGERVLTATHQVTTKPKVAPTIEIVDVVETQTSVGFDFTIVDLDQVGAITAIELYKDNELVESLTDLTLKEFGGLLSNNKYEIKVTYTYDSNDGYGTRNITDTKNILTPKIVPSVDVIFTHHRVWKVSYEIVIYDPELALTLSRVYANLNTSGDYWYPDYNQYELSLDLTGTFDGISSASTHTLYIEYLVDLNDGNGGQTITLTKEFKTPKCNLGYSIESFEATSDSLTFNLIMHDPDNVGQAEVKYELYNSDKTVLVSNQFDTNPEMVGPWSYTYSYTYNDLLSNNTYILVISFKGDLEDGLGFREFVQELSLTTKPKVAPTIEIVDVVETQTSIGFDFTIEDVDLVGNVTSIEIYKNNELVESLSDLTLREFSGLLSNNLYEIRVVYTYNLNDGTGLKTITICQNVKTQPQKIEIIEIIILNTEAIKTNSPINFRINFDNKDQVTISSIMLNGKQVDVIGLDGKTSALFSINSGNVSGDIIFRVEKLIIEGFIDPYSIEVFSFNVPIIGDIEVTRVYNDLNIFSINDDSQNYIYVDISGLENYVISNIYLIVTGTSPFNLGADDFEFVDANTIKFLRNGNGTLTLGQFTRVRIYSITYGLSEEKVVTKNFEDNFSLGRFLAIEDLSVNYISTADELQNLENNKVYCLQNNIDLKGFDWIPYQSSAIIIGNGYSISNLELIVSETQDYLNLGLFSRFEGVAIDITLNNFNIYVLGSNYVYAGLFAGYLNGVIEGMKIIGDNKISVSGKIAIVGGIVGGVSNSIINKSEVSSVLEVNINSAKIRFGGILGYNSGFINRNKYSGSITLKIKGYNFEYRSVIIGGVAAYENGGSVYNSEFIGTINITDESPFAQEGEICIGDIIYGAFNNSANNIFAGNFNIITNNSVYLGISATSENPVYRNNLFLGFINISGANSFTVFSENSTNNYVGENAQIIVNSNNYNFDPNVINLVSSNELESIDFYVTQLNMDITIWNIDNLDYNNGKYPTLR
ncbi:MAG TPA: hypothetical protein PLP51_02990 [Acholeplasmataceae bacterium]|mgnify:FL=1|nr:hypothetical protein [Acholeplasmataceae bacterium]